MSKNSDWIKKSLMGSTTMPTGTGGGFSFLPLGGGIHVHNEDGSCCGHDHGHDHSHAHHHDHAHGSCGHADHEHDESCGHASHGKPKKKG